MKIMMILMSTLLLFGAISDTSDQTKIIYLIGMIATLAIAIIGL